VLTNRALQAVKELRERYNLRERHQEEHGLRCDDQRAGSPGQVGRGPIFRAGHPGPHAGRALMRPLHDRTAGS
jgi:hypothetical protein